MPQELDGPRADPLILKVGIDKDAPQLVLARRFAKDDDPADDACADHNSVILATPTTLVALLRSVAYGWQQAAMSKNAELIRDLAKDLYKRLYSFSSHLQKVGKNLDDSVINYNKAVGSLERLVLPGVRKFTEMGVQAKEEIPRIDEIEKKTRDVPILEKQAKK